MALTEKQLAEAKAEFKRRDDEENARYHQELVRRQREADARFRTKMEAAYPGIDFDTMTEIYYDFRDYRE